MATIDGTKKKLTVSGEAIESAVNSKHEHSNSAVLDKLSDDNGTLQYNGAAITGGGSSYTLPTASETVLGGVKVDGTTITVNGDGIISATGGDSAFLSFSDKNIDRSMSTVLNDAEALQEYIGGLIEIQPDSWDGEVCATDSTTKTWGFPVSLDTITQRTVREQVFKGDGTGLMYIRLPLGFAYRGYRNIDETSGLAKNIGERFTGQNKSLKSLLEKVVEIGGGLCPEYWCPAPYWTTGGAYYNKDVANYITAGGSYDRTTALYTIKSTDRTQYNAQIEAFTDAIIDDLEYLHQNVAPVRMFALQNEPDHAQEKYGACKYTNAEYSDILEVLVPKINSSEILSTYDDEANVVKIIVNSSEKENPFKEIGSTFMSEHPDLIWGYAHHLMQKASGEDTAYEGAEWFKTDNFAKNKGNRSNVFINEYEYFADNNKHPDNYRCANNMLRMIYELIYSEAKTVLPIIHLCKPLGQTLKDTNTRGYCLFISNLKEEEYGVDIFGNGNNYGIPRGKVAPNKWSYNSWALIGENLPIGAYLVGNYGDKLYKCGYAAYKHEGKLYLFFANSSDKDAKISIQFADKKKFNGKYYDIDNCGNSIMPKEGTIIDFVIPAMSGQFWIENTSNVVKGTPASVAVTGVIINETATVKVGGTTKLNYNVNPTNATNKAVTFSVNNSNCTVSNTGLVTGVTEGTSVVTVTTKDGSFTDTCTVTITTASSGGGTGDITPDDLITFEQANTLMSDANNWLSGQYDLNGVVEENAKRAYFTYKVAIDPNRDYGVSTNHAEYKLIVREMKSDGTVAFNVGDTANNTTVTSNGDAAYLLISAYKPPFDNTTSKGLKTFIADGTIVPEVHYV